jgi:hypothetical protein
MQQVMYKEEDLMKKWLYLLLHSWKHNNVMFIFDAIAINDELAGFSKAK